MNKLLGGALVIAVVLGGCGGHSRHVSATAGRSTTRQANTATVATRRPAHPTATAHAAGTPVATVPGSGPDSPGSTSASTTAGRHHSPNPPRATAPGGGPSAGKPTMGSSPPSAADVARAKAALRGCRANDPGITLGQLEREAASPEGIQC